MALTTRFGGSGLTEQDRAIYATLPQVTPVVVEVARESLVIGTA